MGEGTGMDRRAAGKTRGHPGQVWLLPAWMKGWWDGERPRGAGGERWEMEGGVPKQPREMQTSNPTRLNGLLLTLKPH